MTTMSWFWASVGSACPYALHNSGFAHACLSGTLFAAGHGPGPQQLGLLNRLKDGGNHEEIINSTWCFADLWLFQCR